MCLGFMYDFVILSKEAFYLIKYKWVHREHKDSYISVILMH
jgi:hypothetical protein